MSLCTPPHLAHTLPISFSLFTHWYILFILSLSLEHTSVVYIDSVSLYATSSTHTLALMYTDSLCLSLNRSLNLTHIKPLKRCLLFCNWESLSDCDKRYIMIAACPHQHIPPRLHGHTDSLRYCPNKILHKKNTLGTVIQQKYKVCFTLK